MNKLERKKMKEKIKRAKHGMRLLLPKNKRIKSKKEYKRVKKVERTDD